MKFECFVPAIVVSVATSAILVAPAALADSPLTSTPFASAYHDVEIVRYTAEWGLDDRVLAVLGSPEIPNDIRAAIVNQIGWSNEPQANAERYLAYLASQKNIEPSQMTLALLTPEETFAMGYLLAMDRRFSLNAPIGGSGEVEQTNALELLDLAVAEAPRDFSIIMIRALVQSQREFREGPKNWCAVYQVVNSAISNFSGDRNMRPEAVKTIMDYIGIYRHECVSASY
ncbi:MAG TPA: hypothetical protein IGS17_14465 [Oscillatoriales cyanobacterium M59_W2019_021]|nr:MAG: hypothetical protein D6728_09220 [Cyanobacteria bacterium J055]HIK33512.1 hypothetical protein [Oscillatoriales cyanobacterium M4454_W2019_049]HIK52107.1 hypothetical protein [Oscillatoriales cyanobacterium M59_W2019_021]